MTGMYPVQHTVQLGEDLEPGDAVQIDPLTGTFVKVELPVPHDVLAGILSRGGHAGDPAVVAVTSAEYVNSR